MLGILALAGLWRAVSAAALPAISRDGVTFCLYARGLGEQGVAFLRAPEAQQHPLFPTLILGVQRAFRLLGAADSPMTWQRSGQVVGWVAGMLVVVLAGVLAWRLARRSAANVDPHRVLLLALLLAGLLDLNVWLSADVMAEQVHLALYLAAVVLLLDLGRVAAALGCGVCAGLAFLTRQEGFLPVLAGFAVLVSARGQTTWSKLLARAALLVAGFLLCAAPYWALVGKFSTKKDVFDWLRRRSAVVTDSAVLVSALQPECGAHAVNPATRAPADGGPVLARLRTLDLPWYALLPHFLYKLLRAGRVVIPLLAIGTLVRVRRRLLAPAFAGLTGCLAGHSALTLLLLNRYGYLETRHLLVVVMLLVPLAAIQLARGMDWRVPRRATRIGAALPIVVLLPLAAYSLRLPNAPDRVYVDAAHWLVARDPLVKSKRLLCSASPRRTAFYADMRWDPWWDQARDYESLGAQIRDGGAGYFAIEVSTERDDTRRFEIADNRALVTRLLDDPQMAPCLRLVHVERSPFQKELLLFELQCSPNPDSQPGP